MNILITGATGAIGQRLVKLLINTSYDLAILVRNPSSLNNHFSEVIINQLRIISTVPQISESEIIQFDPTVVIHLAGYSSSKSDTASISKLIDANIKFGSEMLRILGQCNLKYFINAGSATEYFNSSEDLNPTYFYSATKTAFRSVLDYFRQVNQFKVINCVIYSVYGTHNKAKRIFDYLLDGLHSKDSVNVSPGLQQLDFIHIDDVCSFFKTLIDNLILFEDSVEEYFVGSGKTQNLKEITQVIEALVGEKLNLNWGGLDYRNRDTLLSIAPTDKNNPKIPWSAKISLQEGIEKWLIEKSVLQPKKNL